MGLIAYIEHIVVICLIAHVAILARGVLSNFHPQTARSPHSYPVGDRQLSGVVVRLGSAFVVGSASSWVSSFMYSFRWQRMLWLSNHRVSDSN